MQIYIAEDQKNEVSKIYNEYLKNLGSFRIIFIF